MKLSFLPTHPGKEKEIRCIQLYKSYNDKMFHNISPKNGMICKTKGDNSSVIKIEYVSNIKYNTPQCSMH